ncbi:hypothetical protein [Streptococcus pneumoniae]|uniref:hypothetical protein n=1 Tax=Streptococcus pneumoniae TaxID=1313 RepID=UPI00115689CC|nr:hypothetical protein [Streptococcus pneumoniae]
MKIKEQTGKLAAGCSKPCFEVVDRTDEVSSKYCFEVVDRTDEVSNHTTARRPLTRFERFSKSIKVYRDEHLFINVFGRGGKDLAAIADYLEAKK